MSDDTTTIEPDKYGHLTATVELSLLELEMAALMLRFVAGDQAVVDAVTKEGWRITEHGIDTVLLIAAKLDLAAEPLEKQLEAEEREAK